MGKRTVAKIDSADPNAREFSFSRDHLPPKIVRDKTSGANNPNLGRILLNWIGYHGTEEDFAAQANRELEEKMQKGIDKEGSGSGSAG